MKHTGLCNCSPERDEQDGRKIKLSPWNCHSSAAAAATWTWHPSWGGMGEETRPDGLQCEQKPGSHQSLSLFHINKSQPVAENLHHSPNQIAPLHPELPPKAALSCPTCQGLAKDNLSWRTAVFWNLRQLLSLPTDLYWEAFWEQTGIYGDFALHFSEAEMSCNRIQHSSKCCLRLPQLKGSITSPTLLVTKTMGIIIASAGSGVCEWEKASHKFY